MSSQGKVVFPRGGREKAGHPNACEGPKGQGLKNAIEFKFLEAIGDLSET